jgi:ABC-type multidrug transport system ATPase subunit
MQLEIQNIEKLFDKKRGLAATSFGVSRGELIAIVGHNGAGKSTLLKILANWIVPDGGSGSIDGIDLKDRAAAVRKTGFIPEVPNLYDFFSVEYNLRLFAALTRTPGSRVEEILDEFKLLPFRKSRVQALSKGLKQRVNIGRALLADPPLLILDEPTSGLDFEMTQEIYRLLNRMYENGKTIIFTSHRPEEIKNLATRIIVMHESNLVFDGAPLDYFQSETHEKLYAS